MSRYSRGFRKEDDSIKIDPLNGYNNNDNLFLFKKSIPKPLKKICRRFVDFFEWDSYYQKSWSQEGEDLILSRVFGSKRTGFYVDVGAHHPFRFSNTYKFYKMGWRGINIDASPGSMETFKKHRKRDINLEIPVGLELKPLNFYIFNEPALNSFDKIISLKRNNAQNDNKIIKTIPLESRKLSDILEEYLPPGQEIDFLSVDAEGLDFEVLKSNDWHQFSPSIVLVEILPGKHSTIENFMLNQGYMFYAKSGNTVFYSKEPETL